MRLYIAEKPSVGRELAKCLTGNSKQYKNYIRVGRDVVTWSYGHLLRQAEPQEYNPKYRWWNSQDLPIIPQKWQLLVSPSCQEQFGAIKKLLEEATEIVHVGDPDREGQLLIDEILEYLDNTKPVLRMLLNALDEKSIRSALADLRDNRDFQNLKNSALARARADWLIGMNLSRAYTLAARRAGYTNIVFPVGRVKIPTLALVVRREKELQNFKPIQYFNLKAILTGEPEAFSALWKADEVQAGLDSEGRLVDRKIAEELQKKLQMSGKATVVKASRRKKEEQPPLPFSLSSLQIMAGKLFSYTPQEVLDTVQRLYEEKLTTYPRSDCEYLPENQLADVSQILRNLQQCGRDKIQEWARKANPKLRSNAWNDKKITAHHAIIPTVVAKDTEHMPEKERNIYLLISRQYLAQFYPIHQYQRLTLDFDIAGERFVAGGSEDIEVGWKELYPRKGKKENKLQFLPKGTVVPLEEVRIEEKETKPPTRFTAATLLAGMKDIYKYVQDGEVKKKLRSIAGIGTEATRAAIIDDLIKRKLLTCPQNKYLFPEKMAELLIEILPEEITYPDFTAMWEDYLQEMAEGKGDLETFLAEQVKFTKEMCVKAGKRKIPLPDGQMVCPRCKRGVLVQKNGKNGLFWGCSNYPQCRMSCDDREGKPALVNSAIAKVSPRK